MHRYGNKQGQLEFDDFIMCAVKLKTMISKYGRFEIAFFVKLGIIVSFFFCNCTVVEIVFSYHFTVKTGGISEEALIEEIQRDYQYGDEDRFVNVYTNNIYVPY